MVGSEICRLLRVTGEPARASMPFAYRPDQNIPNSIDQGGYLNFMTIAKETGVQRFAYTSFHLVTVALPLQDAKRAVEQSLHTSGLTSAPMQPTYFTDAWPGLTLDFNYLNRKATIWNTNENLICWISFLDVTQFAVACLGSLAGRNILPKLSRSRGNQPSEGGENLRESGTDPSR